MVKTLSLMLCYLEKKVKTKKIVNAKNKNPYYPDKPFH